MAATAGAGGMVSAGPLTAGAAEAALGLPVGTALGAYTGRARFLGVDTVDGRQVALPGVFNASVGVETAPRVKALAMSAGGETVVMIKLDIGLMYEGLLFDLESWRERRAHAGQPQGRHAGDDSRGRSGRRAHGRGAHFWHTRHHQRR
jgi:hypothetical protein